MAVLKSQITVGEKLILVVDSDPSLGIGYDAPLGSITMVSAVGSVYIKFGAAVTDWSLVVSAADATAVNVADKIVKRDGSGNFAATNITSNLTGNVLSSGTVAAPGLSFAGDTNTGVYSPAADIVAVATDGAERMRVGATGNVGIANAAPNATLDVTGTALISGRIGLAGAPVNALRFVNLDISLVPTGSTSFGIYNQVAVTSNANNAGTTALRNVVLSSNSQNITRRYIGTLNGAEHTGTGSTTGNNGLVGGDSFGQLTSAASMGLVTGHAGTANNITTGTITNAYGGLFAMNNIGAGFVTTARGVSGGIGNFNAGGIITTAYGLQIQPLNNAGTITTTFGIHIGNQTVGTQTNKAFSLYVLDAAADNFIGGPTKIGAGGDRPTTGFHFDVRGSARFETTLGEILSMTSVGLGFFAVTPVARQTSSGPQTAGATYTATEQTMIQEMYNALRLYGLLT